MPALYFCVTEKPVSVVLRHFEPWQMSTTAQ